MSYLNQAQDPRRRATALAGTVAVHAVLGIAIVTGLTIGGYVDTREYEPIIDIPIDPPPPPPPQPQQQQQQEQDSFITVPPRPLDPLIIEPVDVVVRETLESQNALVIDPGTRIEPAIEPLVLPTFTPRSARPSNNAASWITNEDYPARDLRDGKEGIAAYRLIVGTNGQVSACEVTRSTGSNGLDAATCRFIKNRARFEPATDQTGAKVVGAYTGRVKWEIPE